MVYRIFMAAMLALIVGVPTSARAPLELSPSSKWVLDYGTERCTLMRKFGSGDAAVRLQIDSFGEWNVFRALVAGTALPPSNGPTGSARIRRTGDPRATPVKTVQGTADGAPAISFDLGFLPYLAPDALRHMTAAEKDRWKEQATRGDPEYDATVKTIAIGIRGTTLVLDTGGLGQPLAAMRACVDDMYKSWGMDPVQQKALSKGAQPTSATVSRVRADYPAMPMLSGVNAYVPVRLAVDATGTTTSCVVQAEGIDKAFTAAVCGNLQHRFKPALDADGKPVASMFHTAVFYLVNGWR